MTAGAHRLLCAVHPATAGFIRDWDRQSSEAPPFTPAPPRPLQLKAAELSMASHGTVDEILQGHWQEAVSFVKYVKLIGEDGEDPPLPPANAARPFSLLL